MSILLNPGQKTRAVRAWKLVKWFLIVVAVLIVINWAGAWMVASSNQKKLDAFQQQVGAKSLKELAGAGDESELVAGNGWYFYLAAIGCVDPKTAEVFSPRDDEETPAPTEAQKAAREAQLDRAHPLVADAVGSPRTTAVLHYDDPLSMRQPHLFPSIRLVRLACSSARDHLAAGRADKAAERLIDALAVSEGVNQMPTLLSFMVRTGGQQIVLELLASDLGKLSADGLQRLADSLAPIDMEAGIRKALAGEVFFGLHAWKRIAGGLEPLIGSEPPFIFRWGYPSLVHELDKRAYLNRMVPLALDPTPETARRVSETPPPFYALLTHIAIPMPRHALEGTIASRQRLAVVREALRLELARRKTGELPPPRREIDGLKIDVKETDETITFTAPAPGGAKPLTITLRR